MLLAESSKVKLYFDDDVLKNLNIYLESNKKDKDKKYESLIDSLKKCKIKDDLRIKIAIQNHFFSLY